MQRGRTADKKQSLWISVVSQYAPPNVNIKINGQDFLVSSTLDLILLLFPKTYGPNPGLYKKSLAKLQAFLKPKYKKFIKIFKSTHMKDQEASLQH